MRLACPTAQPASSLKVGPEAPARTDDGAPCRPPAAQPTVAYVESTDLFEIV
jgi:hypothetical protein